MTLTNASMKIRFLKAAVVQRFIVGEDAGENVLLCLRTSSSVILSMKVARAFMLPTPQGTSLARLIAYLPSGASVMNWHEFGAFAPLMLVMDGSEKYRLVKSLGDAAEALFAPWSFDDGDEYLVAVKTCLEALHGKRSPADARAALRAAPKDFPPMMK